jgi:hypothetical protein
MTAPAQLVQKLWNYCNILRDNGLSYGDYVEQRVTRLRQTILRKAFNGVFVWAT